jgi:opacity protein-like surface antigen
MWKRALLTMGLIALMVSQVSAQKISLGPQLGFQKGRDADVGKFMGGVALRVKLTRALGVETSINYRQEKHTNGAALTVRSWPLMATGFIYAFPTVYAAIGAGWYSTTFNNGSSRLSSQIIVDEKRREFGWHFGAGAELPVSSRLILTTDFRYVLLNYDFKAISGIGNLGSNFYVITAGFLFSL